MCRMQLHNLCTIKSQTVIGSLCISMSLFVSSLYALVYVYVFNVLIYMFFQVLMED